MRQPTVDEMFDKLENKELNSEMKEIVENETLTEDTNTSVIKENNEHINKSNEIVEVRYGDEIYKTWTVKLICPLITEFLKGMYPDSLAVRGLTDIVVFDNKSDDIIPVEIQKTPLHSGENRTFSHTAFENLIRKQLEDNIENYGKCWLFFDSEYLRYLQSGNIPRNTNINMTWFIKLMKESTLKVFAIRYDGLVKELTTKDFDFLKNISQMCVIGYDNDERILERNKLKIKKNVLYGYNFTQEEISQFENEFDNRVDKKDTRSSHYYIKSENERCKLYGYITQSFGELISINNILSCTTENKRKLSSFAVILGIFYQNNFHGENKYARIQFVDKFNIAQYFPGYLKNKEMWDYCKIKCRVFTTDEFRGIIEGREHCLRLIKNQSTMLDY